MTILTKCKNSTYMCVYLCIRAFLMKSREMTLITYRRCRGARAGPVGGRPWFRRCGGRCAGRRSGCRLGPLSAPAHRRGRQTLRAQSRAEPRVKANRRGGGGGRGPPPLSAATRLCPGYMSRKSQKSRTVKFDTRYKRKF